MKEPYITLEICILEGELLGMLCSSLLIDGPGKDPGFNFDDDNTGNDLSI